MGRFDNGPEKSRRASEPYGSAESALQAVTEELQIIQRNLLKSLQDDVKRLQGEKIRLADDIKRLQEEKEQLQGGRHIDELQLFNLEHTPKLKIKNLNLLVMLLITLLTPYNKI